jgi:hypothetical protein
MANQAIITPQHIEHFEDYLKVVEQVLPIQWSEVHRVLNSFGGQWPPKRKSGGMLIVSVATRNQCMPFQPLAILASPPNHVSKQTGVLEFKLLDRQRSTPLESGGWYYFPTSVSVFPSGRKILKIYGLALDTERRVVQYERRTMKVDRNQFRHRPLVVDLVTHLITSFPIDEDDTRSQDVRRQALRDLGATNLPEPSEN